ncbi:four-helix bundle copper-binding protein [Flavobacterium sp.]|uniref:four-helix bundle copper-binding protein n=1 Tax=Flavobacterium sp. TaxID=239 RepID=UPI0037BE8344
MILATDYGIFLSRRSAAVCKKLLAALQNSSDVSDLFRRCEDPCNECATECEKHSHIQHCTDCAKACRACAEACKTMLVATT